WKAETQLGGKKPFKDFMVQLDFEKGNRSSDMYWGYWSPAANQTNERGVSHPYRQDSVFLRRSWQWPKGHGVSLEGQWTDTQAEIPAVSAGGFPPPPATVTSLSPMRQTVLRAGVEFRLKGGETTEWRLRPSVVSYKDHVNSSLSGQFPLLEASLVTRF
ncbi:MAG: hypothetical protein HYU64_16585, partial [Armatimonadetes bacterium]|nr:hypothetical protein [Armatimonadota bacterium]